MLTETGRESAFSKADNEPRQKEPIASDALARAVQRMGAAKWFSRNAEIYGEGEPADCFYQVLSGTVRAYKILIDGRRQIGAFYLPGDMFGLEAGEKHIFSAEAVTNAEVLVIRRKTLTALAASDIEVAHRLWIHTGNELRRARNHLLLINKSAPERVATFLLEMAERIGSIDEIKLAMSRQDIADYLGLTIETVSRMLTRFESASTIALPSCKRIVLRNRAVLKRLVA